MSETIYFKDNDTYYKANWEEETWVDNPRKESEPLGMMVFEKNSNGNYGDFQIEDYSEFFLTELRKKENIDYARGTISFELPSVEVAQKNPVLQNFIAGTERDGFYFDKPYFDQFMTEQFSNIMESVNSIYEDYPLCDEITGGIPVSEDGLKLSDKYEIQFRTPNLANDYDADLAFNKIYNALNDLLDNELCLAHENKRYNITDDMTQSELFEKWKATKVTVLPIDLSIHSGETCHEVSVRKTLHAPNDRDDGFIYNDGFIYLDKDNKEYKDQLVGEARDKDGNVYNTWKAKNEDEAKAWAEANLRAEIKEYANYLEGDCHSVSVAYFDPETLSWIDNEYQGQILGSSLEESLNEHGFDTSHQLTSNEVFTLKNTPTKEFKEASIKEFFETVKKNLDDPRCKKDTGFAAAFYFKELEVKEKNYISETDEVNKITLKKEAVTEYLNEKGISSEMLPSWLERELGISKEKELPSLSFYGENLECIYSKNKNKASSAYGSPHAALLIDYDNKRFAYFTGVEYMLSNPSTTYLKSVETASSTKNLEKTLQQLVKSGFKNAPGEEKLKEYQRDDKWIRANILKEPGIER